MHDLVMEFESTLNGMSSIELEAMSKKNNK